MLKSTARVLIVIVGTLMLLDSVGVDMTPILASLGVGSLAIGLALQKALEDFLSGLLIAADQPIRVGDFIEVSGDEAGNVLSIGWTTFLSLLAAKNRLLEAAAQKDKDS